MNALAGTNAATGGNTPNWVTGYVPPASEWNAWWGAKLDVIGGTLNGNLTVGTLTAATVAATTIGANSSISTPVLVLSNGWTLTNDASNNDIYQHGSSAYDVWIRSSGARAWSSNGTTVMTLDATGNLNIPGTGTFTRLQLNDGLAIYADGSNNDLYLHNTGNYDTWIRSSGTRAWVANGTSAMVLDASGNLDITGNFTPNGNINVNGSISVAGTFTSVGAMSCGAGLSIATQQVSDFDIYRVAPNRVLQWSGGVNIAYSETDGGVTWNTLSLQQMKLDSAGNLFVHANVSAVGLTLTSGGATLSTDGSGNQFYSHASGQYDVWTAGTGLRAWAAGGINLMTLDTSGNLTVHGTVHGTNVTTMQETIDELQALVQDLQTRLATLEAQPKT